VLEVAMHPIAFSIGAYPVYAYGICVVAGAVTLFAVALAQARRAGRKQEHIVPMALGTLVGAFVGARLTHVLVEPDKTAQLLDFYGMLQPRTPGNIIGLMIGGFLGGLAVRRSLDLPSLGNYYAPAFAAASVVWRVGCTCGGCCYGKPCNLPWAVHLDGADRHPTMIYEGLFNLVMLAILWRLRRRITRENELLYLYFAAYAIFRFWLEFLRVYPPIAFGLTGAQYLCMAILAWLGIYLWQRDGGHMIVPPHGQLA
jgi:phosphatidylglycerol:prolipoprotein diacylglycerol transferase